MQFIPQKYTHRVKARTENFVVYFSRGFTSETIEIDSVVTKAFARFNFRLPTAYFGSHLLLMSYKQHKSA